MSDPHADKWTKAVETTRREVEFFVLDRPWDMNSHTGRQEGSPGDVLVREHGDEDAKAWIVMPRYMAEERFDELKPKPPAVKRPAVKRPAPSAAKAPVNKPKAKGKT